MSTQATTAAVTTPAVLTVHEFRIERTAPWFGTLMARIRRDRAARVNWQWQPVTPRPVNLQEEILRAQLRMLPR